MPGFGTPIACPAGQLGLGGGSTSRRLEAAWPGPRGLAAP